MEATPRALGILNLMGQIEAGRRFSAPKVRMIAGDSSARATVAVALYPEEDTSRLRWAMKVVFTTQLEKFDAASVDKHDMRVFEARSNLAALPVELQNH